MPPIGSQGKNAYFTMKYVQLVSQLRRRVVRLSEMPTFAAKSPLPAFLYMAGTNTQTCTGILDAAPVLTSDC